MDANYFRNAENGQPMLVTWEHYRRVVDEGHEEITREQYENLVSKFREEQENQLAGGVGYE